MTIKGNLLKADLFPGYDEGFHLCSFIPTVFPLLKAGVQRLVDDKEILFEKTLVPTISCKDVSIITIFANPPRVSTKRPVRIICVPKVAPLIITTTASSKTCWLLKTRFLKMMIPKLATLLEPVK